MINRMGKLIRTWMAVALCQATFLPVMAKEPAPADFPDSEKKAVHDPNRLTAIMVELAWLTDPITFPYYLDARVDDSILHVHGIVPTLAVRDQAIKLARLRCPMNVSDDTVVQPQQMVAAARIPASQLENAGKATLYAILPDAARRFQVSADSAGRIKVMGQVQSFEEKLAISKEFRHVYGCTAVINQAHVVEMTAVHPARYSISKPDMTVASAMGPLKPIEAKSPPIIVNNLQATQPPRTWWQKLGVAKSEPVVLAVKNKPVMPNARSISHTLHEDTKKDVQIAKVASATESHETSLLVTHGTVMITEEPAPPAPEYQLRNHIITSCGIPAQAFHMEFKSAADLEIRLLAKSQDEANLMAQRIFQLPELLPYQVDVQVTIPR